MFKSQLFLFYLYYCCCYLLHTTSQQIPQHNQEQKDVTVGNQQQLYQQQHHHHQQQQNNEIKLQRSEIMDNNGLYILDWELDNSCNEIIFKITVNTRGFIIIGFLYATSNNHNNNKVKPDIIGTNDYAVIWIDDRTGKPNILDCHGTFDDNIKNLQQDDTQNYFINSGYQNVTHTHVELRRQLETCDPHDCPINGNTINVLWSYGDKDPIDASLNIRASNKGTKYLQLLSPLFKKPTIVTTSGTSKHNEIKQWDVTVRNITLATNMDTLYWCKIIRAPILHEKYHIIGYEAILTKESTTKKPLVHHMTLFECSTSSYPGSDPMAWDVWVKSNGAVCNSNLLTPRDWNSCTTPIAVWTIGSTGQFLPEHVGIPMGGKQSVKYYMLEIHYDNPRAKTIIDNSGFRIHYTKNLRKNDGGMMITGVSVSDTQILPPGQKLYRNIGICGPSCTDLILPPTGLNIISVILHSHTAGRTMKLRHIRNGIELERIVEDDNFNVDYQQVRQLINETVILPGDYMITDCGYNTMTRKRLTLGGYSTKQEICLSFIMYYPKIDLTGCYSMTPVKEFFETFGVYQFYSMNMTDVENLFLYNGNILDLLPMTIVSNLTNDNSNIIKTEEDVLYQESILNKLIISDPVEFHDRTFLSHLNQLPWSEPLFTRRVEQILLTGKHMTFCQISNESISVAAEIFKYPNFTPYVKPPSHCPYHLFINQNHGTRNSLKTFLKFYYLFIIIIIYLL